MKILIDFKDREDRLQCGEHSLGDDFVALVVGMVAVGQEIWSLQECLMEIDEVARSQRDLAGDILIDSWEKVG